MDLAFIRSHFPALDSPWVFLDNAGGSQTLRLVADRLRDYLLTDNVQHGATYAPSRHAVARVREATVAMAALINAAQPEEVVMGPSTTAQFRILSLGLGRRMSPGDEIVVTNTDHEAHVSPWRDLARDHGVQLKVWRCRADLQLHLEDLDALLSPRTRLVAVTHCSNVLGSINPIRAIADLVHSRGSLLCVDGVAYAPHRRIDVQALDADFYCFSTYKVFGPHYALLYGRGDLLRETPGINHFFIREDDLPYKFQPGNVNFELAYAMLGLADYLHAVAQHHGGHADLSLAQAADLAYGLFAQHEALLTARLLDYLNNKPGVRIIGQAHADPAQRVATVSFVVEGRSSAAIVRQVDEWQVGIRYGDFYAKNLITDLGLGEQQGVVRVSMVHYNSPAEIDRLIGALDAVL